MRYIFSKMGLYKKRLIVSLTFKALGTIIDLVIPLYTAYIIDDAIPDAIAMNKNLSIIIWSGVGMLAVAVWGWYLNISANRKAEYIASYCVRDSRNELFSKIETLSSKQVDQITTSSLIGRMTTDTYNIFSAIGSIQRVGVRAPMLFIGGIILTFTIDWQLALIMVSLLPIIIVIVFVTTKKGNPLYKEVQRRVDNLIRTLRENITGARVVKALSMVEHEMDRFDKANNNVVKHELKATVTMSKIRPLVDLIMNLGLVGVLVLGAYRISQANLQPGQMVALVTYFTLILNATMAITRVFIQMAKANASANRIAEVLALEEDLVSGEQPLVTNTSKPHIEFDHVYFTYTNAGDHLEDIDFKIYKGQTLGILGATGSGKTTIINLLMRFYDPRCGAIKVYGQDIKELNLKQLRESVGLVLQNDLILSDTVYDNISFNRKTVSEEDVELAKTIAQANFIDQMPEKHYSKLAQRGANISGGQKQRLLIARAIAGKPDILILDDASSALDYQTDMNLRQALNTYLKDTTKIVVAQRVSSIKDCDLILLIDDGRILASGTHEELLNKSTEYSEIVTHQMGGELND